MDKKILDFYLQFSQYTNPGLYKKTLRNTLPDNIKDIGLIVRKSIIHRITLRNRNTGSNKDLRYGDITKVPWYRQAEDDVFPTVSAMLSELYRRDNKGLVLERDPENKLILTCRFVSILMVSLLKIKGIPSRVRSGFAPYFDVTGLPKGTSVDHWISQYWDKKNLKWVTIDVDGSFEDYIPFDRYNMPDNVFDFPARAWLDVRKGIIPENHFYNAGGFYGLVTIAWSLFYDYHSLMNDEIIYFHHPEITILKNFQNITENDLKNIDELAKLMIDPDKNFNQLQKIWESNKKFRLLKGGLL